MLAELYSILYLVLSTTTLAVVVCSSSHIKVTGFILLLNQQLQVKIFDLFAIFLKTKVEVGIYQFQKNHQLLSVLLIFP
jgi:hypothetical protein